MAAYPPLQNYYRQPAMMHHQQQDDYAHGYGDDDTASSILDDGLLDHSGLDSGLEMSPPMAGSRRDSFAVSATMFSPKQEEWQPIEVQTAAFANHHRAAAGLSLARAETAIYAPHHQAGHNVWPYQQPGLSTPVQSTHEGLPFDLQASCFPRPLTAQTPFSTPYNTGSLFSSTTNSSPASPEERWSLPDGLEQHNMPKRMRPHSPTLRSHGDVTRRDGIRKKNARFEIPAERNLNNIDQMIAASRDEGEIKELKQQKRLLRNRQAALDSRQRKKLHTERLEDEKKHYTAVINDLEDELTEVRLALEKYQQKEQQWEHLMMEMQHDKEDMIRSHTLETGELRKKVGILSDHVRELEHNSIPSVAQADHDLSNYGSMDHLAMDQAWDSMPMLPGCPPTLETEIKLEQVDTVVSKVDASLSDNDKPAQGLLLMLLLVGAFVASKGAASVPKMSDDVRAASVSLLQDVFKDAGVPHDAAPLVDVAAAMPSGTWQPMRASATHAAHPTVGSSASMLGDLMDGLSHPTQDQLNEQAFSLSAAQYEGIASQDFLGQSAHPLPPAPPTSSTRRNLAEALAAMRANSKNSAAEVYTRSLLWDQVPADVVRDFAKLVSEYNVHDAGDARRVDTISDDSNSSNSNSNNNDSKNDYD